MNCRLKMMRTDS